MEEKDEKEKICTEIFSPGFGGLPPPLPVALTWRPRSRPSGGTPAALRTAIPALEAQEGEIAAGILRPSGGM